MNAQGKYKVIKDKQYGFFKISPSPTQEEIEKYYNNEFYASDYPKLNDSSINVQKTDQDFYNSRWSDMCDSINDIMNLNQNFTNIKLLDIGCGWGEALRYFNNKGMNTFGFDPVPEAIEYAKAQGINAKVAGMKKMNVFEDEKFNIVTLINVLEHLSDPVKVVKEIKEKILLKNGLLIIDVPNEYNDFQITGQKIHSLKEWWVAPPAHLNYFNNTSLNNLLTNEGYTVIESESSFPLEMFLLFGDNYVGNAKIGKSCHLKRVQFEQNLRKNGKTKKLRDFYKSLAKLNLGRQIVVYAKNN